ncbi:DinB family protein [Nocardioides agariphilus]|uniref:DinB family protein n=1 Tax=Nocardioides agariphilus TaxID=433664 RepID=A0A930VPE7_9ACTN|nr:DinB family protein [Nocardioides agariphilus]MBF4768277.1 DinB family protein [Nocardioides agariphilus]
MPTFTGDDDLQGAEFRGANLSGARFVESDLTGVIMRGVELARADIDAPWLPFGEFLRINGVDVTGFVEAELDKRFPGRAQRTAVDPVGLREAWDSLQRTWDATLARVAAMPPGSVDLSVGGEWSFAQTLRHLVHATDMWLRKAVLEVEDPFHPIGQVDLGSSGEVDPSMFAREVPPYDEVLRVRAERATMVRDFIDSTTPEQLAEERRNPHDPDHPETVLKCLHVILEEEWEHHRFAVRDLDALSDGGGLGSQS